MNNWINYLKHSSSVWVYAPVLFLAWIFLGLILKRILIKRLSELAKKTVLQFDDILVESLSRPLSILIIGSGTLFLSYLLPVRPDETRVLQIAFQLSVILGLVLFVDSFLTGILNLYRAKIQIGFSPTVLHVLLRTVFYGTGALIFLDILGISIAPFIASLGIGSLAVGLALQETLTNFISGVHVSVDKPIRVGDYIKLESGQEGYVEEIGWRSTRIRILPDYLVIVPNQKLTSSIVTNYYYPSTEMSVPVQIGVSYDSDLDQVENVTLEVAREILKTVRGAVSDFQPSVRFQTFGDSSINFTVALRAKEYTDQYLLKHEFIKALHKRYKKEGIGIPYPMRTLDIPTQTIEVLKNSFQNK
ncbi:MAG: hypothetical protein A3G33_01460 [Omnitrophica bacterium RIFCSPLOWO2_12_FULL_44_17]|uniref:Mechanosensitive ion channel protein MscS n=1 Tax=Candidatus Danuiimicrobium aquiferis TaxID=1801832 RepID=A0A1G1KV17_9BACT|nr:MAG: hypothetical protein A3B72_00690 [Omnitrophica bacterium RIFCSPHIGHO2_02_FULL_45_28]OGW88674.1 MAG: hypothetical protein A3E74_00855 [Omnitrophica bacterium RIFCSPHIGHO2_12_FULL_44_12]OGW96783.1 MAG: hypothetical protein A3G33_01460 [Omnitrophica bacterium RIFCSPLOWO2_12_FULL_44_17]OGX03785.1 MAG: hypothetical protein A3J12_09345 [Omnitrophica bacterium RIFCSPLOWO2_02_FULL_44_11]